MVQFDRAWIENELAGLIVQLHQTEGAISVLQQMLQQLDSDQQRKNGAGEPAPNLITMDQLGDMLPVGHTIEGIEPRED